MKEGDKTPPPEIKLRSERRAAKVASTKIAESAKYLASNKIIATTGLPPPSNKAPKAKAQPKTTAAAATTKVPTVAKPQVIAPSNLPKMPILVFNSLGSSMPTLIPIPTSSIAPNSIVTIAPSLQTTTTKILDSATRSFVAPPTSGISSKFPRYTNATRQNVGLTMECEDECLSAAQWAKYRKAENEYMDVLRKLTKWKSRSDVEIVYLSPGDPVPPPPRFLTVQEAAKLPVPLGNGINIQDVFVEDASATTTMVQEQPSLVSVMSKDKDGATVSSGPMKMIVSPRLNLVIPSSLKIQQGQAPTTSSSGTTRPTAKADAPREYFVFKKLDVPPASTVPASAKFANVDLSKYPDLAVKLSSQKLTSHSVYSMKKSELDGFLKTVMHSGRTNIEKWMLEKGLFGVNRFCLFHPKVQMKLMFMSCTGETDKKSGYKWWCPNCAIMVPVNQGSFFCKWKQDYCAVLRVIYHWACNSNIKMVVQEALGNKDFVQSVYSSLRSICTKQSASWKLGGTGHPVEIAEMKLGYCKDVVGISMYCAYDRTTHEVKLGITSESDRQTKLTVLLREFIEKDSYVVGERIIFTFLPPYFKDNFVGCSSAQVNLNAVSYLRDHAYCAIKDVKNDLKLESIQALLSELAWREKYGLDPLVAFNNILAHIKVTFISSVVTTQSAQSVPITMASGLKVVDTTTITENLPKSFIPPKNTYTNTARKEKPPEKSPPTKTVVVTPESNKKTESARANETEHPPGDVQAAKLQEGSRGGGGGGGTKRSADDEAMDKVVKESKRAKLGPNSTPIRVSPHIPPIRVPLEPYYYASKDGVESTLQKQKGRFKFKCQACKKSIEDNIKMMKHLQGHINALKQFNLDLSDLTHCKYCFREFASPYAMQSHVEKVHVSEPCSPVCRICDKEFSSASLLSEHMKGFHTESEMPYKCAVCKYRTSFYRDIISHFQQTHDRTDKLMCNYCLQIFNVRFGAGIQEGQTYTFYRHLYKHQSKTHNKRCSSCCLAFLCNSELQQHRLEDHSSFCNKKGVKPAPLSNKSKPLYIYQDEDKGGTKENKCACIECKMSVHKPSHFIISVSCALCSYTTCCTRSFTDHAIDIHASPPRHLPRPFNSIVPEVECVCGFSTRNGDKMARHLAKCNVKWCYFTSDNYEDCDSPGAGTSSREIKMDTGVEELEHEYRCDDEEREEEEKVGQESVTTTLSCNDAKHNMLNVLGLMRVKPRRTSMHSNPSSIRRSTSSDTST